MTLKLPGPVLNDVAGVAAPHRRWYNSLPVQFDPDYVYFMDDFLQAGDVEGTDWTEVNDGGASVAIEADTPPGWLVITSAATTDNDGGSIQGNESYATRTGRHIWFETVVKPHDADDSDWAVGFTENFSTNPEAMATASNRICFQVDEGNASILCKTEASDVETSSDSEVDSADNVSVTLGIHVLGTGAVEFYVNRIHRVTHESSIPTANMALGLYHISGSATATFTFECDYLWAVMSR